MRYVTVAEHGSALGTQNGCLIVKKDGTAVLEAPLSRLRSIMVARQGVSISSNLITACALRGIRLFFLDWRGRAVAMVGGVHQHATVAVRQSQFACLDTPHAARLAQSIIFGKLRNQRAVLLYFMKYLRKIDSKSVDILSAAASDIEDKANRLKAMEFRDVSLCSPRDRSRTGWRERIMGVEGACASTYWHALVRASLLPSTFQGRLGRHAEELGNQMLNYGYVILSSFIWSAIDNAGLEPFCGILHQQRPGKPSLVLDLMEIFRPWVVDRNVIKLRRDAEKEGSFSMKLKKKLSSNILATIEKRYPWRGKRLRLDTIMQRQAYRFAGSIIEEKPFKAYCFRW